MKKQPKATELRAASTIGDSLPATCYVCPHHYASQILMSPAINEGWCRLDKRGMPDPKKQPPPQWCRLRKGAK